MVTVKARSFFVEITKSDDFSSRTIQHDVLNTIGQFLEGALDIEVVVVGQRGEQLEIELVAAIPAADCAGSQRQFRMDDDALGIKKLDDAETVTFRARPHRVVEREDARLEFLKRIRTYRAGEFRRKQVFLLGIHLVGDGTAIGMAQRGFERFSEALAHVVAYLQPVHHDVDRVLLGFGQFR